jgi:hypothetical protein
LTFVKRPVLSAIDIIDETIAQTSTTRWNLYLERRNLISTISTHLWKIFANFITCDVDTDIDIMRNINMSNLSCIAMSMLARANLQIVLQYLK